MSRLVLGLLALLSVGVGLSVILAPPIYHGFFCSLCRRTRALRREAARR